jgi:hypothetical protein
MRLLHRLGADEGARYREELTLELDRVEQQAASGGLSTPPIFPAPRFSAQPACLCLPRAQDDAHSRQEQGGNSFSADHGYE